MRPAPAWIGWAALAAAATGCCRMQPPSPVESLESTWTKLREGAGKPSPAAEPSGESPSGPPPEPVSTDEAPARSRPIPLVVPPARGESPGVPSTGAGLEIDSPPGSRFDRGGQVPLAIGGASPSGTHDATSAPFRVGSAAGDAEVTSARPLVLGGVDSKQAASDPSLGLTSPAPRGDLFPAGGSLSLPESSSLAIENPAPLVRQSFLPPLRNLMVPSVPEARALPSSPASSTGVPPAAPSVPVIIPSPVASSAASPRLPGVRPPTGVVPDAVPSPPLAGKAPSILGEPAGRELASAVPAGALERAASEDPDREAARRARAADAFRGREAEAGVLRQFLRRVLRLDSASETAPSPSETVSESAR